jgi:serine/threonine protein kinase
MPIDTRAGDMVADRYRLDSLLGSGGMGRVWRGRDEVLGREVAVKELSIPPGIGQDEAARLTRRTVREAQAAARLVHPNIVTVYDVVTHDARPWIVMRLVPGRSLDRLIHDEGPLPANRAAGIALQILAALRVAHAAGVIHRDIKPGNVIVHSGDEVILTDFGIATIEGQSAITSSGTLVGSPTYLAPERALGHPTGPASDLWSTGVTLYEMVEGHPPYQRESPLATLAAVVNEPPTPHRQAGLLGAVLDGLLRKQPETRMPLDLAATLLARVAAEVAGPVPDESPTASLDIRNTAVDGRLGRDFDGYRGSDQPTVTLPDGRKRRRRLLVVAAIVLVFALSAALLGSMLMDDETGRGRSGGQAAPSSAPGGPRSASQPPGKPEPTGSVAATPRPEAPPTGIPDGFRLLRDPSGFALAIPRGWDVSRQDHYVYVRDSQTGRFLLIDQTDQPKADAVADWTRQEAARRDGMRDYERIRIERVDYFLEAADWEFRHTRSGTRLHVVNRGFVTSENQAYGLYWSTPESLWNDSRHYFDTFARTFQPAD